MELVKATIEILSGDHRRIEVQFNPNTLSFRKEVVINEIGLPGLASPLLQFVRGEAETLDLELFCDTTHDGLAEDARDVREHTQPIRGLLEVDPDLGGIPVVRFSWGKGLSFTGVVVSVDQRFTLFSPAGVPLRARLTLRLKEHRTLAEHPPQRPATRSAATEHRLPSTPLRDLDIRSAGKTIALDSDLLAFTLREDLDAGAEFELTLTDWDGDHGRFKYADTSLFDPGASVEIRLRAPLVRSAKRLVKGTVIRCRQMRAVDGQPMLVVTGHADQRRRSRRARPAPLRLAYGESLIEVQSELAGPAVSGGKKQASSRAPFEIRISGTSMGLAELRAGATVEIAALSKRFAGRYLVIATTHTIDDSGYTTHFDCRRDGPGEAAPPRP